MHFSIITPSFNQLDYLKRCMASVRDQVGSRSEAVDGCSLMVDREDHAARGSLNEFSDKQLAGGSGLNANGCQLMAKSPLSVHHHIQDGGSTDGTREFLAEHLANSRQLIANGCTFSYESEPDNGMYDALNRGVELAIEGTRYQALGTREPNKEQPNPPNNHQPSTINSSNHVVAWLNCDEQYLPGTFDYVANYFDQHPEVDMLFGDYLIVDKEGELLSFRKGSRPRLGYIQVSHLNNLSCAMFFRGEVFQVLGGFDTKYKAVADEDFVVRALQAGFKARHARRYFSVFTFTGSNLGGGAVGREEFAALKKNIPSLLKWFRIPLNLSRWIEKFLCGTYFQKFPIEYEIYLDDADRRARLVSSKVGWRWPTPG